MRTGSKIKNPSTSLNGESRELQLLLFNFLCNLNRAAYKWAAEKGVAPPAWAPYFLITIVRDFQQRQSRKPELQVQESHIGLRVAA